MPAGGLLGEKDMEDCGAWGLSFFYSWEIKVRCVAGSNLLEAVAGARL